MAVAVVRDEREFVLKSLNEFGCTFLNVVLPNVSGVKYTFGSTFPGEREGEEFVILRYKKGIVDPVHCIITVNEEGQYWIENAVKDQGTSKRKKMSPKTFVNKVKLVGPRRLEVGDTICLGRVEESTKRRPRPVFTVYEQGNMNTIGSVKRLTVEEEEKNSEPNDNDPTKADAGVDGDSQDANGGIFGQEVPPLENGLILSNIMGYLPFYDLKRCRQVSDKWKDEASKALGKRSSVYFSFGTDYLIPSNSMKVFRYLHEVKDVQPRELCVFLKGFDIRGPRTRYNNNPRLQNPLLYTPGEPGNKMLADMRKLLTSPHKFSSLSLQSVITNEEDFLPYHLIFQEIGDKLVELKLKDEMYSLPNPIPQFPVMSKLRKFSDESRDEYRSHDLYTKWTSHLVPLFRTTLEVFCCSVKSAPYYLEELLKQETPRLCGITIQGAITSAVLSLLLKLKKPIKFLKLRLVLLKFPESKCNEVVVLLEKLLLKNSKTLKTLVLEVKPEGYRGDDKMEIKFPKFPNLEELDLTYSLSTKLTWEPSLNYEEHFPSLNKLKITPWSFNTFEWEDEGNVFNTLFPEVGDTVFETLKKLEIPVIADPDDCYFSPNRKRMMVERYSKFQKRMDRIKEMFPKVENIKKEEVDEYHSSYYNRGFYDSDSDDYDSNDSMEYEGDDMQFMPCSIC